MTATKNVLMMRNANGDLLPRELKSDLFGDTVKVLPISQGDFSEIVAMGNKDAEIICKYLCEPQLTIEEVNKLPIVSKRELIILILMGTGIAREQLEKLMEKGVENLLSGELKKK